MNSIPNGSDADMPTPRYNLHPINHINRMLGFIYLIRHGFEVAGNDYSKHCHKYTVVCDSIIEEIELAVKQLRKLMPLPKG